MNFLVQSLDLMLAVTLVLTAVTQQTHLFGHLTVALLALGALAWRFRDFVWRAGLWGGLALVSSFWALHQGQVSGNPLFIELPILTIILIFIGRLTAQRDHAQQQREQPANCDREQTETQQLRLQTLEQENQALTQEIQAQKQLEASYRETEERYALAIEALNEGIWDWDLTRNEIFFSPHWKRLLGYTDQAIAPELQSWLNLIHPDYQARFQQEITDHLAGKTSRFQIEYLIQHQDGQYHWMFSRGLAFRDSSGQAYRFVGTQTDITERKATEEKLFRNAFYDTLTGLPNRALFQDRLNHVIESVKNQRDRLIAVLFLDLDRFKVINDSLGHMMGDQLLAEISQRLKACIDPSDTIARLGGDEFAILLENSPSIEDIIQLTQTIQTELSLPFYLEGQEVFTTTSIGIAISTEGYSHPEDLLRDADIAMYRAKASEQSNYIIFNQAMHERAVTVLQLESSLRRAIEREEFQVYYQPIVSLRTGKLNGFEALVRWLHPERGLVSPADFIPIAEETRLIIPIGYWVLREACRQLKAWQEQFPSIDSLTMSVNLSAKQFSQPDLIEQVEVVLQETGLDPHCLKVEITESALLENPDMAVASLEKLQALGLGISVDDFGTGYSSLSYLHRFPINTLKIDRSFVNCVDSDIEKIELIRTITKMAWNLGMDVIAEGVEIPKQLAQLKALRCESGQGYLFSKPMTSALAADFIVDNLNLKEDMMSPEISHP